MMNRYVLISPCRDEAEYLPVTIRCVASQTAPPARWVIVDDGSTDATPEILADAAARHPFIEVVRREDRGRRSVGPGVIDAFYAGLKRVDLDGYDFLCKLDVDLKFPPGYFRRLMELMHREPRLGNISGKSYVRLPDGRLASERLGDENAIGQSKFYRVACFRDIGGFVREVSWDGIDGHMCRMKGWIARSVDEPGLRVVHLRRMGSSYRGLWTGRKRWGMGKYYMGSAWYYAAAVAAYRMLERPYIIGGLGIAAGYAGAAMARRARYPDAAFRRHLRRYELESLFLGKRRTADRHHDRLRAVAVGG
jgi:poly-beta-1,6-N-acetyl-D-glucosamine synthase